MTTYALQCGDCGSAFTQPGGRPSSRCPACRVAHGIRVRQVVPPTVELMTALAETVTRQTAAIVMAKIHLRAGRAGDAYDELDRLPTVADTLRAVEAAQVPEQRRSPDWDLG